MPLPGRSVLAGGIRHEVHGAQRHRAHAHATTGRPNHAVAAGVSVADPEGDRTGPGPSVRVLEDQADADFGHRGDHCMIAGRFESDHRPGDVAIITFPGETPGNTGSMRFTKIRYQTQESLRCRR